MEPHIKQRYHFAASAYVRMHGYGIIHNHSINQFCIEWSKWEVNAPLDDLNKVDQYFHYEYKNWRGI